MTPDTALPVSGQTLCVRKPRYVLVSSRRGDARTADVAGHSDWRPDAGSRTADRADGRARTTQRLSASAWLKASLPSQKDEETGKYGDRQTSPVPPNTAPVNSPSPDVSPARLRHIPALDAFLHYLPFLFRGSNDSRFPAHAASYTWRP